MDNVEGLTLGRIWSSMWKKYGVLLDLWFRAEIEELGLNLKGFCGENLLLVIDFGLGLIWDEELKGLMDSWGLNFGSCWSDKN